MKSFCSHTGLLHENKANAGVAAPFLPPWQKAASTLLVYVLTYLRPVSAGLFLSGVLILLSAQVLFCALVVWLVYLILYALRLVYRAVAGVIDGAFGACFNDL